MNRAKLPVVSLREAIRNIVETRTGQTPVPNPFVFLVGAGISYPSIPLAGTIAEECEKIARGKGVRKKPKSNLPIDQYTHWFREAFPDPTARQRYFQKLIEANGISSANFRLAHLLTEGFTNLVITPNFDTYLSQALRLFGYRKFRVCDHPATTARMSPEIRQTQIIHVHGTFEFYDLCNLKGEIEARARLMAGLLDDIFRDHVPMVIGYSGWDGDVITKALKRRLKKHSHLPYTLYWFCHKDCPQLDWLCSNSDVRLVLPPKNRTLSAEEVLDELIREMGYKEPQLACRPIKFMAEQLRESLPREKDQPDPYSLRSVAARIQRAGELEEAEFDETDEYMERVRNFVRAAKYIEAADAIIGVPLGMLNGPQLEELREKISQITPYVPGHPNFKRLEQLDRLADDKLRRREAAMVQDEMFSDEP